MYFTEIFVILQISHSLNPIEMKAKIIFFLALLLPLTMFAQNKHLSFKGVPINGTLRQFTTKLVQKGFSKVKQEQGVALLKGEFAGYKACDIIVLSNGPQKTVYSVGVFFPGCNDWESLKIIYNSIQEKLTTNYGEPSVVIEEFKDGIEPYSNYDKFLQVILKQCTFKTLYTTEKGDISLSLWPLENMNCCVFLIYTDKINEQKANSSAIDDL